MAASSSVNDGRKGRGLLTTILVTSGFRTGSNLKQFLRRRGAHKIRADSKKRDEPWPISVLQAIVPTQGLKTKQNRCPQQAVLCCRSPASPFTIVTRTSCGYAVSLLDLPVERRKPRQVGHHHDADERPQHLQVKEKVSSTVTTCAGSVLTTTRRSGGGSSQIHAPLSAMWGSGMRSRHVAPAASGGRGGLPWQALTERRAVHDLVDNDNPQRQPFCSSASSGHGA